MDANPTAIPGFVVKDKTGKTIAPNPVDLRGRSMRTGSGRRAGTGSSQKRRLFPVRLPKSLHGALHLKSLKTGMSMNEIVVKLIRGYVLKQIELPDD